MGFLEAFRDFPEIETERLLLREIAGVDAVDYFKINLGGDHDFGEVEAAEDHIRRKHNAYKRKNALSWGIVLKEDGQIVGECRLSNFIRQSRADIWFYLGSEFRRRGMMSEAFQAIIPFAFASMELHRIQGLVSPKNEAAVGFVKKLGFVEEGWLREYRYDENEGWVDVVMYALLEGEGGESMVDYLNE